MRRIVKAGNMLFAAVLVFAAVSFWGADREQNRLADDIIRLHVIANSDSEYDQAMKLRVRDIVLDTVKDSVEPGMTREEAADAIRSMFDNIIMAATTETGNIPVSVALDNEFYPTRTYDTFSLPAGEYLSLKVTIGEADGHNWWCVVFPPLCTEACSEDAAAAWGLSRDEVQLMQGQDGYIIKFKIIEWWEQLKHRLK